MSRISEDVSEFQVRMDVARNLLDLSSVRLLAAISFGSSESVNSASMSVRIARTGLLLALSELRDLYDLEIENSLPLLLERV